MATYMLLYNVVKPASAKVGFDVYILRLLLIMKDTTDEA